MSEELTARLIAMVSEMSDAVHKTQQDVAVLKVQQQERKESQEKALEQLRIAQERDHGVLEELKKSRDKISVLWAVLAFAPAVIAAVCAVITLTKH